MLFGHIFLALAAFVVAPLIAASIIHAASKGKPKSFDSQMYFTLTGFAMIIGCLLVLYALRMQADVRTWQYWFQLLCAALASWLLFGVAIGCVIATFVRRFGPTNENASK
jgi:hypothetical protein